MSRLKIKKKKIIDNIIVPLFNLINHAYNAGKGGEALPLITTLAALLYILPSTLGSGSYIDIFGEFGEIYKYIMIVVSGFAAFIFSLCLFSYLDNVLDFVPRNEEGAAINRLIPKKHFPYICGAFIVSAIFVAMYNFYKNDSMFIRDELSSTASFWIVVIFLIASLIYGVESFFEKIPVVHGILFIFVVSCTYTASINIYRDAYKNSLITNAQYCYWTFSRYDFASPQSFGRVNSGDYKMCNILFNDAINFSTINIKSNR